MIWVMRPTRTDKAHWVGIDLGTTYSAIAYVDESGRVETVGNREGDLITPSVVLFEADGTVVVGRTAKEAARVEPERVIQHAKRDMGLESVGQAIDGRVFRPEEVSGIVLRRLQEDFEGAVGGVAGSVITVPAYFDDGRRGATRAAGEIAGLPVAAIVNEPVAAALAYAMKDVLAEVGGKGVGRGVVERVFQPQTVLVFDLGGGTFDVSIVRCDGERFETLVTDGNVRLGGTDWDERLTEWLMERFREEHGVDAGADATSVAELRAVAESLKLGLTARGSVPITAALGGKRLSQRLTRAVFAELTADLLAQTQLTTELIIEEAQLGWDQIDKVLLVGGSTRMPMVREMLSAVTGREPDASLAADLAVAQGAAIYAGILAVRGGGGSGEAGYSEGVRARLGSAVVRQVNAHSLGVVARNRAGAQINSVLIPKNSALPRAVAKTYGLETAGSQEVAITVLEGEARDPGACAVVGEFVVRDLPAGLPARSPIRITCRYDEDGRIHVEATEMVSGNAARVEIQGAPGLRRERIDSLREGVGKLVIE